MEKYIRVLIRWHWLPLLGLVLINFFVGHSHLATSKSPFTIPKFGLELRKWFSSSEITDYHSVIGNFLLVCSILLILTKLFVWWLPIRRQHIPNGFIRWSIETHYITYFLVLFIQYSTIEYQHSIAAWISSITDRPFDESALNQLHNGNSMFLVIFTIVLVLEKFYLISLKSTKTKRT